MSTINPIMHDSDISDIEKNPPLICIPSFYLSLHTLLSWVWFQRIWIYYMFTYKSLSNDEYNPMEFNALFSSSRIGAFSRKKLGRPPVSRLNPNARFDCPKCPRFFSRTDSLRRHLRRECGLLPKFKCPYCSYRGSHKYAVKTHVKRIHVMCHTLPNWPFGVSRLF